MFLVLKGTLAVVFFNSTGEMQDVVILDNKKTTGVDIKPGVWHSIVALEPSTVIFEVKTGPYVQATDKDFASWAPAENTPEALAYLSKMQKHIQERTR
jgi:cupin fold WbuC family metalloprotein